MSKYIYEVLDRKGNRLGVGDSETIAKRLAVGTETIRRASHSDRKVKGLYLIRVADCINDKENLIKVENLKNKIAKEYQNGMSISLLARNHHKTIAEIEEYLDKAGVREMMFEELENILDVPKVMALKKANWSIDEIAYEFCCIPKWIERIVEHELLV